MEQTTQQITQKPPFPIKTKIAAWWLIVVGLFLMRINWFRIVPGGKIGSIESWGGVVLMFGIFYIILSFLISIFPAISILKRKKWAWIFATIIISIFMIGYLILILDFTLDQELTFKYIEIFFIIHNVWFYLLPPFFLLLLDRKNFFKIAK